MTQKNLPKTSKQRGTDSVLTKSSALQAYIIWLLNIVYSEYLVNSSTVSSRGLFDIMFPDGSIAIHFNAVAQKPAMLLF